MATVELSEQKIALAAATFARSGLASSITLVHDDAGHLLRGSEQSAFDLIFLDSERTAYPAWWPHLRHALRPGGLLVVDNAISPVSAREELVPFVAVVKADPLFSTSLVPVGKGEFLAVKAFSPNESRA